MGTVIHDPRLTCHPHAPADPAPVPVKPAGDGMPDPVTGLSDGYVARIIALTERETERSLLTRLGLEHLIGQRGPRLATP